MRGIHHRLDDGRPVGIEGSAERLLEFLRRSHAYRRHAEIMGGRRLVFLGLEFGS